MGGASRRRLRRERTRPSKSPWARRESRSCSSRKLAGSWIVGANKSPETIEIVPPKYVGGLDIEVQTGESTKDFNLDSK